MKIYDWNDDKNIWLRETRGVTFEEVIYHITHDALLDIIEHPNRGRYGGQKIFIVNIEGYAFIVPFVENNETIFMKTIIPSRKMTRIYLK